MSDPRNDHPEQVSQFLGPESQQGSRLTKFVRTAVLALLLLVVAWWFWPYLYGALTSDAPIAQSQASEDSKYAVSPGVYRQANSDSGERYLSIDGATEGRLVIELTQLSALLIGASRVEIDTSWEVDGDDVTFYLHEGRPETSYQRLLTLKLEKETRFHIRKWEETSLTLERVQDGEIFHWERIDDEPLPDTPITTTESEAATTESSAGVDG